MQQGRAAAAARRACRCDHEVGAEGEVFKTRKGELSLRVQSLRLLSKSLRPLPDKFHGIHDQEIKYRQRYVDLSKGGWQAVIPQAVADNPEAMAVMAAFWQDAEDRYAQLRGLGIRKEDARFLLPNAAETRIVTTMNFAAWSHFLWLRAVDKAAQWEIRAMGQRTLEMLYAIAPAVFQEHWDVYQARFAP